MTRSLISHRPLDRGLKGLIVAGPVVLVFVGALHADSWGGVVVLILAALAVAVLGFSSGARVSASPSHFRLSFVPFWTVRLRIGDVAEVRTDRVRPFEDFGGWGIKGSSRKKGLFFSAGGEEVVVFVTRGGRRYLVSVREGDGHRVVSELEARGASGPENSHPRAK